MVVVLVFVLSLCIDTLSLPSCTVLMFLFSVHCWTRFPLTLPTNPRRDQFKPSSTIDCYS